MWNFNDELNVMDCVRGVILSCYGNVCRVMLETGDSGFACFCGAQEQTEVLCTVIRLPHAGKSLLVSIDCIDSDAAMAA